MSVNIFKLPAIIFLFLISASFIHSNELYDGKITDVKGSAWLVQQNNVKTDLSEGMLVKGGEVLTTGKDGFVRIEFFDGSSLSMVGESTLDVRLISYNKKESPQKLKLASKKGTYQFQGNSGAQSDVEMEFPNSKVSVKGSQFFAHVDKKKTMFHGEGVTLKVPNNNIVDLLAWDQSKKTEANLKLLSNPKGTPVFMAPDGSFHLVYAPGAQERNISSEVSNDGTVKQTELNEEPGSSFNWHMRKAMHGSIPDHLEEKTAWVNKELPKGAWSDYAKTVQSESEDVKKEASLALQRYQKGDQSAVLTFSKKFIDASSRVNNQALKLDGDLLTKLPDNDLKTVKTNALKEKVGLNHKAYNERSQLVDKFTAGDSKSNRSELVKGMRVLNLEVKRWDVDIQSRQIQNEMAYFKGQGDAEKVKVLSSENDKLTNMGKSLSKEVERESKGLKTDVVSILSNPDLETTQNLIARNQQETQASTSVADGQSQVPSNRDLMEQAYESGLAFGKGKGTVMTENGLVTVDAYHFYSHDDLNEHISTLGGLTQQSSDVISKMMQREGGTSGVATVPVEVATYIANQNHQLLVTNYIAQANQYHEDALTQSTNTALTSDEQKDYSNIATYWQTIASNLTELSEISSTSNLSDIETSYNTFGEALDQLWGKTIDSAGKTVAAATGYPQLVKDSGSTYGATEAESAFSTALTVYAQDISTMIEHATDDINLLPPLSLTSTTDQSDLEGFLVDLAKQQSFLLKETLASNATVFEELSAGASNVLGSLYEAQLDRGNEILTDIAALPADIFSKFTSDSVDTSLDLMKDYKTSVEQILSPTPGTTSKNASGTTIQDFNIASAEVFYSDLYDAADEQLSGLRSEAETATGDTLTALEEQITILAAVIDALDKILIPNIATIRQEFTILDQALNYGNNLNNSSGESPSQLGAIALINEEGLTTDGLTVVPFDWDSVGLMDCNIVGSSTQGSTGGVAASVQASCTDSMIQYSGTPMTEVNSTGRQRFFSCPTGTFSGNCSFGPNFETLSSNDDLRTYSRYEVDFDEGTFLTNVSLYNTASLTGDNVFQDVLAVGHTKPNSLTRVYYPFKTGNDFITMVGSLTTTADATSNSNAVFSPDLTYTSMFTNAAVIPGDNGGFDVYTLPAMTSNGSEFLGKPTPINVSPYFVYYPSAIGAIFKDSAGTSSFVTTAQKTSHLYSGGPSPSSQDFNGSIYEFIVSGPMFSSTGSAAPELAGISFGKGRLKNSGSGIDISSLEMAAVTAPNGSQSLVAYKASSPESSPIAFALDTENFVANLVSVSALPDTTVGFMKNFIPSYLSDTSVSSIDTLVGDASINANSSASFVRSSPQFLVYDPDIDNMRDPINTLIWGTMNVHAEDSNGDNYVVNPGLHTFFVGGQEGQFPMTDGSNVIEEPLTTLGVFKGSVIDSTTGDIHLNEGLLGMRQDYRTVSIAGEDYNELTAIGIFSGQENSASFSKSSTQSSYPANDSVFFFKGYLGSEKKVTEPYYDSSTAAYSSSISSDSIPLTSLIPQDLVKADSTRAGQLTLNNAGLEGGDYRIFAMPLAAPDGSSRPDGLIFNAFSDVGSTATSISKAANLVGATGSITPNESPWVSPPNALSFFGTSQGFIFDSTDIAFATETSLTTTEGMLGLLGSFPNGEAQYDFVHYPTTGALRMQTGLVGGDTGKYAPTAYSVLETSWPSQVKATILNDTASIKGMTSDDLSTAIAGGNDHWNMAMQVNVNFVPSSSDSQENTLLNEIFEFWHWAFNFDAPTGSLTKGTNTSELAFDFDQMTILDNSGNPITAAGTLGKSSFESLFTTAFTSQDNFTLHSYGGRGLLYDTSLNFVEKAYTDGNTPPSPYISEVSGQTAAAATSTENSYTVYSVIKDSSGANEFTPILNFTSSLWQDMNAEQALDKLSSLKAELNGSGAKNYTVCEMGFDVSAAGDYSASSVVISGKSNLNDLLGEIKNSNLSSSSTYAILNEASNSTLGTAIDSAVLSISGSGTDLVTAANQLYGGDSTGSGAVGELALCEFPPDADGSNKVFDLSTGSLSDLITYSGTMGPCPDAIIYLSVDKIYTSSDQTTSIDVSNYQALFQTKPNLTIYADYVTYGLNALLSGAIPAVASGDHMTVSLGDSGVTGGLSVQGTDGTLPLVGSLQSLIDDQGNIIASFEGANVVDPVWVSKDLFFLPSINNLKGITNLPDFDLSNTVLQGMPGIEQYKDLSWGTWRMVDTDLSTSQAGGLGYFAFGRRENASTRNDLIELAKQKTATSNGDRFINYYGKSIGTLFGGSSETPVQLSGSATVAVDLASTEQYMMYGQVILSDNQGLSDTSIVVDFGSSTNTSGDKGFDYLFPGTNILARGVAVMNSDSYTVDGVTYSFETSGKSSSSVGQYSGAFYNKTIVDSTTGLDKTLSMKQFAGSFDLELKSTQQVDASGTTTDAVATHYLTGAFATERETIGTEDAK